MSASRLCIAAAVLLAVALVRPGTAKPSQPQNVTLGIAGVMLAAHFFTWIASLEYTTVAISTLLVATTPIWTATFDAIFMRRALSRASLIAFAAGGAGLVAVVGFNHTPPPIAGHETYGAILAAAGGLSMAVYLILVRQVRSALDTRTIVTRTYTWAAVVLAAGALVAHQAPPALNDLPAWGGIVAMALISQLLGHTSLNAALRWFSPSAVSFSCLLEPICAALLALAIFGETIGWPAALGGAVVLASIGVVLREERAPEVVEEPL